MKFLPRWCLSNLRPTIYDAESGSVIEQTAKVYGAMNELIEDYNKFADSWNEKIEQFINKTLEDEEAFRVALRQEFQDFINVVELKIMELDNYAKNEVATQLNNMFKQILEGDELKAIVRAELSSMSTAISDLTDEMNTRLSVLSSEITSSASSLRSEMSTAHSNLSSEIASSVTAHRNEVNALITTLTNTVNDVAGDVADLLNEFIVEKGTSGAWNYRKYNSGVVECWGGINANITDNNNVNSTLACNIVLPEIVTSVTEMTFTSKNSNLIPIFGLTDIIPNVHCLIIGLQPIDTSIEYQNGSTTPVSVHLFGMWK